MTVRRVKRDMNGTSLVGYYRLHGVTYADLAAVGGGVPDGAVGIAGITDLVEMKNPDGRNRLEPSQEKWHRMWRGSPVRIVRTLADVVEHVADMRRRGELMRRVL